MLHIIVTYYILVFVLAVFLSSQGQSSYETSGFDFCVGKGYQILESSPRQCRTPDGRVFVEGVLPDADRSCGMETPGQRDECCNRLMKDEPHPPCSGEWRHYDSGRECRFICTGK